MQTSALVIVSVVAVVVIVLFNIFFLYIPVTRIEEKVDATTKKIDTFLEVGARTEKKVDGVIEVAECLFASLEGSLYCRFFPSNCTNGQPNLTDICPSENS